tara:strand:- start:129730 stop:130950 length:1221 start_codon:yes stop_codon:yes gene_type:complete
MKMNKMKKISLIILILLVSLSTVFGQKKNIVNAALSLKTSQKSKGDDVVNNLRDAKKYIDEAYKNESTSNDPKMWNYRSKIYLEIAIKYSQLDDNAIFKATEAYINCMNRDQKGRVVVRKWTPEEELIEGLINCGFKLFNTAIEKYNSGEYELALKYYNQIFNIIPFDNQDRLSKGNIKKETILYNSFFAAKKLNDNIRCKKILEELIDIDFSESAIFIHISDIYIDENNNEKALEYLDLGRNKFPGDQGIINSEINLYIKLGRTTDLIAKLADAIEISPENHLLYFNRGTIYDQQGDFFNAESDYIQSLNIKPESFGSNYNLGALYFNKGVGLKNKANDSDNDKVYKKLNEKATAMFDASLPYLEKAYNLVPKDKNTLLSLKQLYYLKEDYKKSEEMKKNIAELK